MKRSELHLHIKMSILDGVIAIPEMIEFAEKNEISAFAITNLYNVQSFPEAYYHKQQSHSKVKIIFGIERRLAENGNPIIILVQKQIGLKNLYKLISLANTQYFCKTPRIPQNELKKHRDGLLVGCPMCGSLVRAIKGGLSEEEIKNIINYYDYFEISPSGDKKIIQEIIRICDQYNKPIIITSNAVCLDKVGADAVRVLNYTSGYETLPNPQKVLTSDEIEKEFAYLSKDKIEALFQNSNLIADSIDKIEIFPEQDYSYSIKIHNDQLTKVALERLIELYGKNADSIIMDRFRDEIELIINNDFSFHYITMRDIVKKAKDEKIETGYRGGLGSSFIAYLIGITNINPLPPHYICPNCHKTEFFSSVSYGIELDDAICPICGTPFEKDGFHIPYEVYMGCDKSKQPDIRLCFASDFQEYMCSFLINQLGKNRAIKAGFKVALDVPAIHSMIDKYIKAENCDWDHCYIQKILDKLCDIKLKDEKWAGGVIVVPQGKDVYDYTPVGYNDHNELVTHFEFYHLFLNCIEINFNANSPLQMLMDLKHNIPNAKINLNDGCLIQMLHDGDALGISEFDSEYAKQIIQMAKPNSFGDIVKIVGLLHSEGAWTGNSLIKEKTILLDEITSTRDDILLYLMKKGMNRIFAFYIMESVRKGKGLTDEMVELMLTYDIPEWYIDACKHIKYLCPKAEAIADAKRIFEMAYFKTYHPEEYNTMELKKR